MYIKYADDPVRKRVNSAFGNVCNSDPKKNALKLIDRCFTIVQKEKTLATFCELEKLNYPVDGFSVIDVTICADSSYRVFDNNLETIQLVDGKYPLSSTKDYVRGIILWVEYPTVDSTGDEVKPEDMNLEYSIPDNLVQNTATFVFHEFFSHFANPFANDATQLLNKLDLYNPSQTYSVKVKGLVIYTKSDPDPNKQC